MSTSTTQVQVKQVNKPGTGQFATTDWSDFSDFSDFSGWSGWSKLRRVAVIKHQHAAEASEYCLPPLVLPV